MAADYSPVRPQQPLRIKADTWNGITSAARDYHNRFSNGANIKGRGGKGPNLNHPWYPTFNGLKITFEPAELNNIIPTVGGVSLDTLPRPIMTISGVDGLKYLYCQQVLFPDGTVNDSFQTTLNFAGPIKPVPFTVLSDLFYVNVIIGSVVKNDNKLLLNTIRSTHLSTYVARNNLYTRRT